MSKHESRLEGYRRRRDRFFAEHPHSPLTKAQRARFSGLDYFPEQLELAFDLPLDESGPGIGEEIELPTSDGETRPFSRAGRIHFPVEGQDVTLTVLHDPINGGLFLPFFDALAGSETYAAGRFLEPQLRPDGTLTIDFNYAYNPFCAYGEDWSCPVPPEENRASAPIRAGERVFRGEDDAPPK